jgi:hypothetical protein
MSGEAWSDFDLMSERPWSREALDAVIDKVIVEMTRGRLRYKAIDSGHYGYAVTLEELQEAWDAIKNNDLKDAKREMIQVAACAIRFALEL